MADLLEVTESTFDQEVLKSEIPVLVDFWAPWCMPCKAIAPTVEEIAIENADKIKVVKFNVDDSPLTPSKYGIRGIPTLLIFKNGELADQLVGAKSKAALIEFVRKQLG